MSTEEFSSGISLQGSFRMIPWGFTEEDVEEAEGAVSSGNIKSCWLHRRHMWQNGDQQRQGPEAVSAMPLFVSEHPHPTLSCSHSTLVCTMQLLHIPQANHQNPP